MILNNCWILVENIGIRQVKPGARSFRRAWADSQLNSLSDNKPCHSFPWSNYDLWSPFDNSVSAFRIWGNIIQREKSQQNISDVIITYNWEGYIKFGLPPSEFPEISKFRLVNMFNFDPKESLPRNSTLDLRRLGWVNLLWWSRKLESTCQNLYPPCSNETASWEHCNIGWYQLFWNVSYILTTAILSARFSCYM